MNAEDFCLLIKYSLVLYFLKSVFIEIHNLIYYK